MKIAFSKAGRGAGEFRYRDEGTEISGTLRRKGVHEIALQGTIEGEITLFCDRCGSEYAESVRIPLELTLTDRPLRKAEDLDTIEFFDGVIDLSSLMEGEIASYRSSYHYCPRCEGSESEVELEY